MANDKITTKTTTTYKGIEFELYSKKDNLRMFTCTNDTYAIIVNSKDIVLFEFKASCAQNTGFITSFDY